VQHLETGRGERRREPDQGHAGIVSGRLHQRSYDTKEGEKRTVVELEVDEVGPSLKYATTKINKVSRNTSENRNSAGQGSNTGGAGPWGASTPARDEEPPF